MLNLPLPLNTILSITEKEADSLKIVRPIKNNEIAVIFDNFLRDKITYNLLDSIARFAPGVKIYISEQGVYDVNMQRLYERLKEHGHEVINVGFDAGISVARNRAIEASTEEFIFMCDCDNIFTSDTNLKRLVQILKTNRNIGLLSLYEKDQNDQIDHYEHDLERKDIELNYIVKSATKEDKTFFWCDYTPNTGMANRKLFEQVKYEESMKLAEHLDFFMQIKYNTNYTCAVALNTTIKNQRIKCESETYKAYRNRNQIFWSLYRSKWGLEVINNYKLPVDVENKTDYYIFNKYKVVQPNTLVAKPKIEIKDTRQFLDCNSKQSIKHLIDFTDVLDKYALDYYIVGKTCLNYVRHKALYSPYYLGIPVLTTEAKADLKNLKFKIQKIVENKEFLYERDNILIHVDLWKPNAFKLFDKIESKNFKVPFPVVQYLKRLYGPKWEKLAE